MVPGGVVLAMAQGLGACLTSWASYGGEELLRNAVGVPDEWLLAGHRRGLAPAKTTAPSAAAHFPKWYFSIITGTILRMRLSRKPLRFCGDETGNHEAGAS
jgi:hypothetical protein